MARFETYRAAAGEGGVVLLGHNRDDTLENVFTNINKGQHYDDLRGMRPVGVERGVATWRPMLDVDKAAIYDAAAALGLPHLRDSTDPTCDRGKLRDDWLPAVRAKQPLLPEGLERLSDHLAFLQGAAKRELGAYFEARVVYDIDDAEGGRVRFATLPLEAWMVDAPPSFWVDVFHRLSAASDESPPRPSNKALANLRDWLRRNRGATRATTCELNASFRAELPRGTTPALIVHYLRPPPPL